jgi:hypothetical protein
VTCNAFSARYAKILKNVSSECVGIAVILSFPKHTCKRQHNLIPLLDFVFMPPIEICLVSLNGLGKRDETRNNSKTMASMDKQSILLDS